MDTYSSNSTHPRIVDSEEIDRSMATPLLGAVSEKIPQAIPLKAFDRLISLPQVPPPKTRREAVQKEIDDVLWANQVTKGHIRQIEKEIESLKALVAERDQQLRQLYEALEAE